MLCQIDFKLGTWFSKIRKVSSLTETTQYLQVQYKHLEVQYRSDSTPCTCPEYHVLWHGPEIYVILEGVPTSDLQSSN